MQRTQFIAWSGRGLVALMLLVIVASAWLRLGRDAVDCALWPVCRFEHAMQAGAAAAQAPFAGPVRAVHRAAASLALPLILAALVAATVRLPRLVRARRLATLLLAVALGLAALGVAAGGSQAGPVVLGNLLGGFTMLAAALALARHAHPIAAELVALRVPARRALLAWLLQVMLGAVSAHGVLGVAAVLHLGWAFVTAAWTARLARRVRRAGAATLGNLLLVLIACQWLLGGAAALRGAPATLVVLHNLSAAGGFALLALLAWMPRPARAYPP